MWLLYTNFWPSKTLLDLAKTSAALHNLLNLLEWSKLVLVRRLSEVADLSNVDTSLSEVVLCTKVREAVQFVVAVGASVGAILWNDKSVCAESLARLALEDITFNENLVVAARVDGLVQEVNIEVVEDVLVTETASRATGTLVLPVVVVVGDV